MKLIAKKTNLIAKTTNQIEKPYNDKSINIKEFFYLIFKCNN